MFSYTVTVLILFASLRVWRLLNVHFNGFVESIVTIYLDLFSRTRNKEGKSIAGPRWEWVNGQLLQTFLNGREKAAEWRRHGHVYRIWAGHHPQIVLTRPEDVRAFHTDSAQHEKARSSNAGWFFHQLLGECMGLINGSAWTQLRRELRPVFSHGAVTLSGPGIIEASKEYMASMESQHPGSFTAKAADVLTRFPFFCTATCVYGELTEQEKNTLWSLGQRSLKLMGHVLSGGYYRFWFAQRLYPTACRDLAAFIQDWKQFNYQVYQSRKSIMPGLPIVSLWDKVLENELDEMQAVHTLSEILFANLDVATGTLSWLVVYLAMERSIQGEVEKEIQQHSHDLVRYCDMKDTLLARCLSETFRLRPFTVFSIPESSPSDKVLGGFMVPAHTSVTVDTLAINYNQQFWGKNADVFFPDRFKSIKPTDLRYNLFVFGFGTRKCLGSDLAPFMMKLFVAQLLSNYSLSLQGVELEITKHTSQATWVPIPDQKVKFEKKAKGWLRPVAKQM